MCITDVQPITDDDLRDDARLLAWLTDRFAFAGLPASRYLMVRGIAAAEWAAEGKDEPARFLAALINRGLRDDWEFLPADRIAAAVHRLAELQEGGQ